MEALSPRVHLWELAVQETVSSSGKRFRDLTFLPQANWKPAAFAGAWRPQRWGWAQPGAWERLPGKAPVPQLRSCSAGSCALRAGSHSQNEGTWVERNNSSRRAWILNAA